jgi:hypothetical protein
MIISDFDGTLSNSKGSVPMKTLDFLKELKSKDTIMVIATGRSLFSAYQVMDFNYPIDYLIFSSGAGIMDWTSKEIIYTAELNSHDNKIISRELMNLNLDFMIHYPIPDNHYFDYLLNNQSNQDFHNRLNLYSDFANKIESYNYPYRPACQFLAIEDKDLNKYLHLKETLKDYSVIRTTSPLNYSSIWIEIFNNEVSKSSAAKHLSNLLNLHRENIMCIGNDYNDLDMLEWSLNSYVVDNAPYELKMAFTNVESSDDLGFVSAVNNFLNK